MKLARFTLNRGERGAAYIALRKVNPEGIVIIQPRVARNELPWVD